MRLYLHKNKIIVKYSKVLLRPVSLPNFCNVFEVPYLHSQKELMKLLFTTFQVVNHAILKYFCGVLCTRQPSLHNDTSAVNYCNFQNDACRKAAEELEKKYPESTFPILIQAAVLFREKHHLDAVGLLEVSHITYTTDTAVSWMDSLFLIRLNVCETI